MKLTTIILLTACITASARGLTQTVSLSEKDAPIEQVFKDIERQTGYSFFFDYAWIGKAQKVTIHLKNVTIEEALQACFKDQPLTYTIVDKTVVVKLKSANPNVDGGNNNITALPPPIDVRGRIVNENGEPVEGASVQVKGNSKGTTTNSEGYFELRGVDNDATLVITGVNINTQEIKVNGRTDLAINATVKNTVGQEVTINKGYYTERQKLSVGNVSTVKAIDIQKQPVNNPLLALEGRVPGLFITQANGLPGGGVTVRIQGQNSITKGNDPLYVIDGVPYLNQNLQNIGAILGGSGGVAGVGNGNGNPMSYINPANIESIEILKDADATSIYGSRAANGAILITTKKGKAGATKIDLKAQYGFGKIARKLDLLNTRQYLDMRYEAFKNDNLTIPSITTNPNDANYDVNGVWDTTRHTDWQKELIGGTAKYYDVQAAISGGAATVQYLVSGGYHRETTVFPGDFSDQKGNLHFNINSSSFNQKFRLQLSNDYSVDDNRLVVEDLTKTAIITSPDAPALRNDDGSLNWAPNAIGKSSWINPLSVLRNKYKNKTYNLISNAILSYQILPHFQIKSNLGFTNLQTNEVATFPLEAIKPEDRANTLRVSQFVYNKVNTWIIEPQASYKTFISKGSFEALVGTTIEKDNFSHLRLQGRGYNSDLVLEDIKSAPTVIPQSSIADIYKYNAIFSRINYNWEDKYIVNLTARRDGSSRFGSENQFHDFGSVGVGWIFSNEEFISKHVSFISFGKLKASYGTTGNDQIGNYSFLNLYNPINVGVSYQGATGLLPDRLANPYLQWEETKKLQIGLELELFKSRLVLNSNYYKNRSSNQLLIYSLPISTGFSGITSNFPATVENTGWEFSVNTINFKTKDLEWSTAANLTIPKNKLVAFPNLAASSYASFLLIGKSISNRKVYEFRGVNQTNGVYQFGDGKGGTTIRPDTIANAQLFSLNTDPKFYGGLQTSFKFKGIVLDVLFQFVKQNGLNYFFGLYPGISNTNQPISVLNRWQKTGDQVSIQRFNSNLSIRDQYEYATSSNQYYSDASYIRLKNLSLSWSLPERWIQKSFLQSGRIFFQGQNLLTFTNYTGMDPENLSTLSLPPLKVLSFGVQLAL